MAVRVAVNGFGGLGRFALRPTVEKQGGTMRKKGEYSHPTWWHEFVRQLILALIVQAIIELLTLALGWLQSL